MLPSWPVHDGEIVLLKLLKPPGQLTLRLLEISQPCQRLVIHMEGEVLSKEIRVKVTDERDDCQQLPVGNTVSSLRLC